MSGIGIAESQNDLLILGEGYKTCTHAKDQDFLTKVIESNVEG